MSHVARAWLDRRHVVHVTLKADRRAPSFRSELVARLAGDLFDEMCVARVATANPRRREGEAAEGMSAPPPLDDGPALGRKKRARGWRRHPRATDAIAAGFHVVHFSLQEDHVHLLVEATDARALSLGMRRLVIRLAKRINLVVRHATKGKVWGDRYHRHDLKGPTEVRNALVYVFQNARRHGHVAASSRALDAFSSADDFDGWADAEPDPRPDPRRPWTWLLRTGWRRGGGLLRVLEAPSRNALRRLRRRAPSRA